MVAAKSESSSSYYPVCSMLVLLLLLLLLLLNTKRFVVCALLLLLWRSAFFYACKFHRWWFIARCRKCLRSGLISLGWPISSTTMRHATWTVISIILKEILSPFPKYSPFIDVIDQGYVHLARNFLSSAFRQSCKDTDLYKSWTTRILDIIRNGASRMVTTLSLVIKIVFDALCLWFGENYVSACKNGILS